MCLVSGGSRQELVFEYIQHQVGINFLDIMWFAGSTVADSIQDAAGNGVDLLVLAVKPQNMDEVAKEIRGSIMRKWVRGVSKKAHGSRSSFSLSGYWCLVCIYYVIFNESFKDVEINELISRRSIRTSLIESYLGVHVLQPTLWCCQYLRELLSIWSRQNWK